MLDSTPLQPLPEDWSRALAIVAHPDDLEYGASSAVARWTAQGKWVGYVMVTRGEAGIDSIEPAEAGRLRSEEERASGRLVGVDSVDFLDHRDGVVEYGLDLRRDIARLIRRHRPEVLITLHFGLTFSSGFLNMADHRAVGLAVLDGARDAGNRWIFPELLDEGLEPWDGVRLVGVSGSPQATHGVDVTACFHRGVASLAAHRVYLENLGQSVDPEAFLRPIAEGAGNRLGCALAVSFEVIWLKN